MRWLNFLSIALVMCTLSLSACEWQATDQGKKHIDLICNNPQVIDQYKEAIKSRLQQTTEARIRADYAALVDGERAVSGLMQSSLQLDNAHPEADNNTVCHAQLNVALAQAVFDSAQTYAPFIYLPNRYSTELDNVANANLISRQGNLFTQNVTYTVTASADGKNMKVSANDTELTRIAQTLTTALLPYGVKDTVMVDGVATPRDDALQQIMYPVPDDKTAADKTIQDDEPVIRVASDAAVQDGLQNAQEEFTVAQNQLNELWSNLDDIVRQSLSEEEERWAAGMNTRCPQQKNIRTSSAYAQLECRTRLIRERIHYLQGFAVAD